METRFKLSIRIIPRTNRSPGRFTVTSLEGDEHPTPTELKKGDIVRP